MKDNEQIEMSLFEEDKIELLSKYTSDEITEDIIKNFDYVPTNNEIKTIVNVPYFPANFKLGVIVGSSGSGKSTILKRVFGDEETIEWDNTKCIASHFANYDEASSKLGAVGLNSIPSWLKPYSSLSTGEKFRADLARRLKDGARIDEYTSVVNRETAISCSNSIKKYIDKYNLKNIVISTCHDDVIPFLQPDWVYNTDKKDFERPRQRPQISINIYRTSWRKWGMFSKHHYLSGDINKASRCYVAMYGNREVAFISLLPMFSKGVKNGWREHRVVVLPDFQGLGIGNKLSETMGQLYIDNGYTYYSKTANPRMGEHRNKSSKWKPTIYNMKNRKDYEKKENAKTFYSKEYIQKHKDRVCYSHRYVGDELEKEK